MTWITFENNIPYIYINKFQNMLRQTNVFIAKVNIYVKDMCVMCVILKARASGTNWTNFNVGKWKFSIRLRVDWARSGGLLIQPRHGGIFKLSPPGHNECHPLFHTLGHTARNASNIGQSEMAAEVVRYRWIAIKLKDNQKCQLIN